MTTKAVTRIMAMTTMLMFSISCGDDSRASGRSRMIRVLPFLPRTACSSGYHLCPVLSQVDRGDEGEKHPERELPEGRSREREEIERTGRARTPGLHFPDSPYPAGVLTNHGLSFVAAERLGELRHVRHDIVDPVPVQRMRVHEQNCPHHFRTQVA